MISWKDRQFYKDGEPIEIHAGSIHYFRSMPEKWRELLMKLKNCGLNAVETYCAWNLHEPSPGVYNFSGRLDLERFIKTATELGLYIIIRPGPYICAEWEFGGFPAWLLEDECMRLRTDEGDYLKYVERYFEHLMPHIVPYLETNGGNILMVAAENEYGSFGNSTKYMNACVKLLKKHGIDVPIFTADGHTKQFLDAGHADNCLCALDFGYDKGNLSEDHTRALWERMPDAPAFHVEFWIGMFSHWGKAAQGYRAEYVEEELRKHLERKMNFSIYMFHGGTDFGFMNGANYFMDDPQRENEFIYYPDATSYDYDALLTEWGEITPKYLAVQKVMSEYLGKKLPKAEPVPVMSLGEIKLTEAASLFSNLKQIGTYHESSCPHPMEFYGQGYGYILYRTKVQPSERINQLFINGVADRASVYFNGVFRGIVHRNDKKPFMEVNGWMDEGGTLDILVENQGRINFGYTLDRGDRKGILESVMIHQDWGPTQTLYNWEIFTLPMDNLQELSYEEKSGDGPMFYRGSFEAKEKKESFIHLDNFEKGFVVVNGFNLGRYWNVGPQRSLYLPAAILKNHNEIIVFSEKRIEDTMIDIRDYHILDQTKTEEGPKTIV